jgi:hypothetical protein
MIIFLFRYNNDFKSSQTSKIERFVQFRKTITEKKPFVNFQFKKFEINISFKDERYFYFIPKNSNTVVEHSKRYDLINI